MTDGSDLPGSPSYRPRRLKRGLDVVLSGLALIVLSPILAVIALAVRLRMGRPILFRQTRPGLHGKPFRIVKFRTMRDGAGRSSADVDRVTPLGAFLRSTSLDELPELWNVLIGEMSLVGPRPLLMDYLPLYSPEQARRHELRPGITGWAQVNGRNAIGWEEKFSLDVWYVDHQSLWLDFKIMLLTVVVPFQRKGINAGRDETMPRFTGSDLERRG